MFQDNVQYNNFYQDRPLSDGKDYLLGHQLTAVSLEVVDNQYRMDCLYAKTGHPNQIERNWFDTLNQLIANAQVLMPLIGQVVTGWRFASEAGSTIIIEFGEEWISISGS